MSAFGFGDPCLPTRAPVAPSGPMGQHAPSRRTTTTGLGGTSTRQPVFGSYTLRRLRALLVVRERDGEAGQARRSLRSAN
jgi:hypothetical protein